MAAAEAKAKGLDVRVVEFSDWTTPNVALDNGDLDLNYFQHQAFLDNAVRQNGFKLKTVGSACCPISACTRSATNVSPTCPRGPASRWRTIR